jgi:hypothetical protein
MTQQCAYLRRSWRSLQAEAGPTRRLRERRKEARRRGKSLLDGSVAGGELGSAGDTRAPPSSMAAISLDIVDDDVDD